MSPRALARSLVSLTFTFLGACGPAEQALPDELGAHVSELGLVPSRLADLETGPNQAGPRLLTSLQEKLLFLASTPTTGDELWVLDPDGSSRRLADIGPGSRPAGIEQLVEYQGRAYFAADDGLLGSELWSTDGTSTGTKRLLDLWPGNPGSRPGSFVVAGQHLFFVADDGVHGRELWRTDGTEQGTAMVKDILPALNRGPEHLTPMDGILYFWAYAEGMGNVLWRSDGSAEGTSMVSTDPASPILAGMVAHRGALYFLGGVSGSGIALFRSDGTAAGTTVLKRWEVEQISISRILAVNNALVFPIATQPFDPPELWRSDGTTAGTRPTGIKKYIYAKGVLGNLLLFSDDRGVWRSDLTPRGTYQLGRVLHGGGGAFAVLGSRAYFSGSDGQRGHELWSTDGQRTTRLVHDLPSGAEGSSPRELWVHRNQLLFSANVAGVGRSLWGTAGQAPRLLVDPDPANQGSNPRQLMAVGESVYFVATTQATGAELFRANLTTREVALVGDIAPGNRGSAPENLQPVNGRLAFQVGNELWLTDGTPAGTRQLPFLHGSALACNDQLIGSSWNGYGDASWPGGYWKMVSSNGIDPPWVLTKLEYPPLSMRCDAGRAYFVGVPLEVELHGRVYVTDGTPRGTRAVELAAASSPPLSEAQVAAVAGGRVFVEVWKRDEWKVELWAVDTAGSAVRLGAFGSRDNRLSLGPLVPLAGGVLFSPGDSEGGGEPWFSDGTLAGTRRLADLAPGPASSRSEGFTAVGSKVYFTATRDAAVGPELWVTDGRAVTGVAAVSPAPGGFHPRPLVQWRGRLVLAGSSVEHGRELFITDAQGTSVELLADVVVGPSGSDPSAAAVDAADRLVFVASDDEAGAELWHLTAAVP